MNDNSLPKSASFSLLSKHIVSRLALKGICEFFLVGNESLKGSLLRPMPELQNKQGSIQKNLGSEAFKKKNETFVC